MSMDSQGPTSDDMPMRRGTRQRHAPEVYRRRRLMVGIVAAVVLLGLGALIVWAISLITAGDDQSEPVAESPATASGMTPNHEAPQGAETNAGASQAASDGPSSAESETENSASCTPGQLTLEADTDAESYSGTDFPELELRVTHTGDEPCTVNVGTAQQDYVVSQVAQGGATEVFASSSCTVDATDEVMEFEPGQTSVARLPWERVTANDDCTEIGEASPGQYQLVVHLGEVSSQPVEFELN